MSNKAAEKPIKEYKTKFLLKNILPTTSSDEFSKF